MSFKTLEKLSANIGNDYPNSVQENQAWEESAFNWIRTLPPGRKGAIGRKLACGLLQSFGFTCLTQGNLIKVNGQSISVKTSLMWGAGVIKFQNIRDSDFNFVLCLGIYPTTSLGWLIPKDEIWSDSGVLRDDREGLRSQHGGQAGSEDAWIGIDTDDVQDWLKPYGGTTDAMITVTQKSL